MKVFTQEIDIALQSPKRFWVAPYSDFKIGVKIVKNGTPVANEFTVKQGSTTLTADETKVDGFTTYTIKSGSTGSVEYAVEVAGVVEKQKITQIVTDSTVFDIDLQAPEGTATQEWVQNYVSAETSAFVTDTEMGAAISTATTDMATQTWVGGQISAFVTDTDMNTAIGTATTDMATQTWVGGQISDLVSGGGYGQAPKLSAITAVYETDWATLSATTDANTFYVVLPDPV